MLKRSTKPTRIAPSTVAPTGRSPSPTQRSWPLRSSKCGPPKPGWTTHEHEDPKPVKVTNSNMNDYFDEMSCKGRAASSGLSAMKFNISDSSKTRDNRVGSSRTGSTRILEKAIASAGMGAKRGNKMPEVNDKNLSTVRSRRNTVVSDHKAGQMKIKGAAGSKGKAQEGKKTAEKFIDLTLDNDGSDSVEDIDYIMNPGPTDAPLNFQVHSEPLIALSEDKAEDPMSLRPRKPAAVDSLRSKRRHNSISNTTPQANIEQKLFHNPVDKPSPAKSLKSMQLKRLYIVPEDDKSIALPWPVPRESAFVHVFDRKVSLRGDKPSCFELDVESAHIKEVHTPDPKEEQTKVILILKSGFWRSCSGFRNQVEKWSCTSEKGKRQITTTMIGFELNDTHNVVAALISSLHKLCKPGGPNLGLKATTFWADCIPTGKKYKIPYKSCTQSSENPRDTLLNPQYSTDPVNLQLTRNTASTRPSPPNLPQSRSAHVPSSLYGPSNGLPFEELIESLTDGSADKQQIQNQHEHKETHVTFQPTKKAVPSSSTNIYSSTKRLTRADTAQKVKSLAPDKLALAGSKVTAKTPSDSDTVLVWPYEGTNSVAITGGDLKRLEEGEFLNDTLIEFGLKWELEQIRNRDPALCESIHMFNSFFYQKLSKKQKAKTVAEESKLAYDGVWKWTKKVDLFKKNFVVIPINEHMHWYFLIVANPNNLLSLDVPTKESAPLRNTRANRSRTSGVTTPNNESEPTAALSKSAGVEEDANQVSPYFPQNDVVKNNVEDQDSMAVDTPTNEMKQMKLDKDEASQPKSEPEPEPELKGLEDKKSAPSVFTFDSLGSTPHRLQGKTVLRYLVNEAHAKLNRTDIPHSVADHISVTRVEVPEQPNFCDCGLYLIHTFKKFFEDPINMMKWIDLQPTRKGSTQNVPWLFEVAEKWDAEAAGQARERLKKTVMGFIPGWNEYLAELKLKRGKERADKEEKKAQKVLAEANELVQSRATNGLGDKRKAASDEVISEDREPNGLNSLSAKPASLSDSAPNGKNDEILYMEPPVKQRTPRATRSAFIDDILSLDRPSIEPGSPSGKAMSSHDPNIHSDPRLPTKRRRLLDDVESEKPDGQVRHVESRRRSGTPPGIDILMQDPSESGGLPSSKQIKTPPSESSSPPPAHFSSLFQFSGSIELEIPNLDGEPIEEEHLMSPLADPSFERPRETEQGLRSSPVAQKRKSESSSPLTPVPSISPQIPTTGKESSPTHGRTRKRLKDQAPDPDPASLSSASPALPDNWESHSLLEPPTSGRNTMKRRPRQINGLNTLKAQSPQLPPEPTGAHHKNPIDLTQ